MCDLDAALNLSDGEDVARRLVRLSRAARSDLISVAGPCALDALSLLCRDDFERVQCARQATCAAADDASDVLILAGAVAAQALPEQLHRTLRLLRDGGVLTVQLNQLDDDIVLQRWLDAHGFDVASTVFDLSHEVLVAHTLSRRQALQAAA
jgi:hypothetical protein